MTSKQRAFLRGLGGRTETIVHIGKSGISDMLIRQVEEALTAREIVKGKVLESAPITSREACDLLSAQLKAEQIQVIGSKFVLYRENRELAADKRIRVPKD